MKITVEEIRSVNKGNVRAFADVSIADRLTIYGLKVIQLQARAPWVALPQREWTDETGKTRYSPTLKLAEDIKRAVDAAVLGAWEGQR